MLEKYFSPVIIKLNVYRCGIEPASHTGATGFGIIPLYIAC